MDYKIILQRKKEYKDVKKPQKEKLESSTIGELKIYKDNAEKPVFECFTVENGGPSTNVVGSDRRILPGIYHLRWTSASVSLPKDFRPRCITTLNPKDENHEKRRIHIHAGNYPQDTEGCILLNKLDNKNGTGSQSQLACSEFYKLVDSLGELGEKDKIINFELVINEIE